MFMQLFALQHDPRSDSRCVPNNGGNFIMFESSSNGNDPNNDNFSPCSRNSMAGIITDRGQTGSTPCFLGVCIWELVCAYLCACVGMYIRT